MTGVPAWNQESLALIGCVDVLPDICLSAPHIRIWSTGRYQVFLRLQGAYGTLGCCVRNAVASGSWIDLGYSFSRRNSRREGDGGSSIDVECKWDLKTYFKEFCRSLWELTMRNLSYWNHGLVPVEGVQYQLHFLESKAYRLSWRIHSWLYVVF